MGSGSWSASTYNDRAVARARTGTDAFDYSKRQIESGQLRVHQTLDISGLRMRESRDTAEHPNSNAIIISLDVTGSMGRVCRGIHADLPRLLELLLAQKYISDPQIMFGAVGDATCDAVPFQLGQFESDNRMDQNLENMILEGGGGGQNTESYELMLYVAARHTTIDCFEKRKRKGYLFMIGDEMAYPGVSKKQIDHLIGPELQANVPLTQIVAEVLKRYHLYFVIPGGASHGNDKSITDFWAQLIGPERILHLEDPADTSESIAMTIGINEGAINLQQGVAEMSKRGILARSIDSIRRALGSVHAGPATVKVDGHRHL